MDARAVDARSRDVDGDGSRAGAADGALEGRTRGGVDAVDRFDGCGFGRVRDAVGDATGGGETTRAGWTVGGGRARVFGRVGGE